MAQKLNINETPGLFMPTVHFSQGDIGRQFLFEIVSEDGYTIPSGATVTCVGTKPSGFGFTAPCTVDGNTVTLVATDDDGAVFTDEAGEFRAEIRITSGDTVIGTANFVMSSETNPHPDGTIDGEKGSIVPVLTALVLRIESAAADVDAKYPDILDAKTDAEAARDAAAQSATNAAGSAAAADNSKTDAEAAAEEAEQSAIDAERYAQSVNPDNLAHRTGTYDGLTAGISKAVIDVNDYIEDSEPYLFRAMPEGTGKVEKAELVGGTVVWNQLAPIASTASKEVNGVTITNNQDGSFTLNGTCTETTDTYLGVSSHFNVVQDHVYLIPWGDESIQILWNGYSNKQIHKNTWSLTQMGYYIHLVNGHEYTNKKVYLIAIDLTAFFGNSEIAEYVKSLEQTANGAGIAWLRKYFPDLFAYSLYNTGTLESVKPTAHVTRGANILDTSESEWEIGYYDTTTGLPSSADQAARRLKHPMRIFPGARYHCNKQHGRRLYYDADDNYISATFGLGNATTPSNAYYMRFYLGGGFSNGDMETSCVNLYNEDINGKFVPYESHTYPITELELRGIPKLVDGELRFDGDTRKADGSTQRRFGKRAYQSGDESLTDAITDGTNTVYKLTTPTTEELTPFEEYQLCNPYGTEEFETTNGVPVGNNTKLFADVIGNLEKRIEALENA